MFEIPLPFTQEGHDAHQQVCQQSTPYLPFYGIPAKAYKGAYLKRLLDFLEESLDAPSAAIQVTYAGGSPVHIIAQETDGYFLAIAIRNFS